MKLSVFREVLEASWRQLDEAVDGLDEAAMGEPGVVERWSVKDLLGHVAAWDQQALRLLGQFSAREPLTGIYGPQVDIYNADEAERRAGHALAAVREELADVRGRLRERLAALSEDEWQTVVGQGGERFGEWLGATEGGPLGPGTHAAEHAHHILKWRVARAGG